MSSVVGIFPNLDAVAALAHAMKPAGFDIGSLTVISTQEPTGNLASVTVCRRLGTDAHLRRCRFERAGVGRDAAVRVRRGG